MANKTGPWGLRPIGHKNGAPWNGAMTACRIGAAYAAGAMYIGDPVVYNDDKSDGDDPPTMPSVIAGTGAAGQIVLGAIVAFDPYPDNLSLVYRADLTSRIAYVAMGADLLFEIRGDGSGTYNTAWVGANAAMVNAGGSTITGLSGFQLDESTPAATQNMTLHVEGFSTQPDNEGAIYARWIVSLNTSLNSTGDSLGVLST